MDLKGKRIAITGANGALGRAVSQKALALGAEPVLLDLAFGEQGADSSTGVERHSLDLRDAAAVKWCFAEIGAVDGVFNLAGGFDMGPAVHEVTDESWEFLFDINVKTMHNVVRAVVPGMLDRGRGAIVNVGAAGALSGLPHMGAYCASKSVVMRLTESLSAELKQKNINVNAVLPGVIDTPANRRAMPDADVSQWVATEDLASAICFLASGAACAIHGALIPVTGRA
ncbi:SDR family oxidoreductase [Microbulbifer taiwanensis]|uniref:SDR family oxidoreductase n=1 Tax=Microbulbifer taiwanensis TaxID=986746 RepID=A0ABW1YSF2_9GAMM|nr:SDR family NAD(P)-dependent oxidoreductase [Microbulbifer taiwanensis]